MRIHHSASDRDGTRYPNEILQDERLTWAARGLLVDLLSRPDGWHGNIQKISREARKARGDQRGEGRDAVGRLFAELERFGYMTRNRTRDAQGNFMTMLEVYDTPQHADIGPQPRPNNRPTYPRGFYLYRHWDAAGRLLYVGIAKNPGQRERQHAKASPWMVFQVEMTVERFETRPEAVVAHLFNGGIGLIREVYKIEILHCRLLGVCGVDGGWRSGPATMGSSGHARC